jgi:hypothetical protein
LNGIQQIKDKDIEVVTKSLEEVDNPWKKD